MSNIDNYVKERLVYDEERMYGCKEVYASYRRWCKRHGEPVELKYKDFIKYIATNYPIGHSVSWGVNIFDGVRLRDGVGLKDFCKNRVTKSRWKPGLFLLVYKTVYMRCMIWCTTVMPCNRWYASLCADGCIRCIRKCTLKFIFYFRIRILVFLYFIIYYIFIFLF